MDGHSISALTIGAPSIIGCPVWIAAVVSITIAITSLGRFSLLIMERRNAVSLSRQAYRDGRHLRWNGGDQPFLEIDAAPQPHRPRSAAREPAPKRQERQRR
jgi:hypothetical protein